MIICSISTIPNRTDSLIQVMKKILDSTILPNKILLSISKYYPRLKKEYPQEDLTHLKDFLSSYPIDTEIVEYDLDVGPTLKLITPISWIKKSKESEDYLILTVDDDSPLYNKALECMIKSHEKNNHAVHCIMGCNPNEFVHAEQIWEEKEVESIGGYRGVLYPYSTVKDMLDWINIFLKEHSRENIFPMHDDNIFSYYMRNKKVKMFVSPIPDKNQLNYHPIPNENGIMSDILCGISMEKTNTIHTKIEKEFA